MMDIDKMITSFIATLGLVARVSNSLSLSLFAYGGCHCDEIPCSIQHLNPYVIAFVITRQKIVYFLSL
jgi:hypothetical protein